MSLSDFEAVACLGKFKYNSRTDANKELRRKSRLDLNAYRCTFCGCWHVGTKHKKFRRPNFLKIIATHLNI